MATLTELTTIQLVGGLAADVHFAFAPLDLPDDPVVYATTSCTARS